jgi:hypothetical protein
MELVNEVMEIAREKVHKLGALMQGEVLNVHAKMMRHRVAFIPEHMFKRMRIIGCNLQHGDSHDAAIQIWEKLVNKEWKVLVYHKSRWNAGRVTGRSSFDSISSVLYELGGSSYSNTCSNTYNVRCGNEVLMGVPGNRIIIMSFRILAIQDELDDAKRDLQHYSQIQQAMSANLAAHEVLHNELHQQGDETSSHSEGEGDETSSQSEGEGDETWSQSDEA